jgi:hypothetical protein
LGIAAAPGDQPASAQFGEDVARVAVREAFDDQAVFAVA